MEGNGDAGRDQGRERSSRRKIAFWGRAGVASYSSTWSRPVTSEVLIQLRFGVFEAYTWNLKLASQTCRLVCST
jgi:hypothetical protein